MLYCQESTDTTVLINSFLAAGWLAWNQRRSVCIFAMLLLLHQYELHTLSEPFFSLKSNKEDQQPLINMTTICVCILFKKASGSLGLLGQEGGKRRWERMTNVSLYATLRCQCIITEVTSLLWFIYSKICFSCLILSLMESIIPGYSTYLRWIVIVTFLDLQHLKKY